MSEMVTAQPADLGVFARIAGVIFSPTETFKSIVARPRPWPVLFIVCLVVGLSVAGPQFTEAGRQAALAMQVEQVERFTGNPVTPEMYAQMEGRVQFGAYASIIGTFVFLPVATLVFSALYWALFNVVLGGTATFGQVLGVNAHAQVIAGLGALISAPVQLLQGRISTAGPFNLGALVPMLEPTDRLVMFLSAVTVFGLWQSVVTGLGLGVLYQRKPTTIVVVLIVLYLAITAFFSVGIPALMGR